MTLAALAAAAAPRAVGAVSAARLLVTSEAGAGLAVLDTQRDAITGEVDVGLRPRAVPASPGDALARADAVSANGTTWRALPDEDAIAVVDEASGATVARVSTCAAPRELALSPDGARLYVACEGAGAVGFIDTQKRTALGALPVGAAAARPKAIVVSADGRTLFVSNGEAGSVSVLDAEGQRLVAVIDDVGARPWGMALDPSGRKLYVANGPSGDVAVIDLAVQRVVKRIAAGVAPRGFLAL